MNKTTYFIIALVVVAGASFYGGTLYQKQTDSTAVGPSAAQRQQFANGRGARNGMNGNDFINGQILSKSDKSITVQLRTGGSKIVFLGTDTQISKFDPGTITDLTVGGNVSVSGTDNADGSVTAKTVQLRPENPNPMPRPQ